MSQMQRVGKHMTSVRTDDEGTTTVTYQRTAVVKFDKDSIVLDSNGYRTHTTKSRMVQASNQFNLGFTVYQKDFDWFVVTKLDWDNPIPFVDGMVLTRGKR